MATNGFSDEVRDLEHLHEKNVLEPMKVSQESYTKSDDEELTTQAADVSARARGLTSRVLDFLSTASNETLGACLVALGATTWLILGRVGLVIIGIVGGVVLHATWEGNGQGNADAEAGAKEARKRREKGLDVVARVLDWRETSKDEKSMDRTEPEVHHELGFKGFQPETGAALEGLTDAVIRDYVK